VVAGIGFRYVSQDSRSLDVLRFAGIEHLLCALRRNVTVNAELRTCMVRPDFSSRPCTDDANTPLHFCVPPLRGVSCRVTPKLYALASRLDQSDELPQPFQPVSDFFGVERAQ